MKYILLIISAILAVACTPIQANRGNMVEEFRLAELTPGVSNRTNVLRSLGSPTTTAPFNDQIWYYMGQKIETKGIFSPDVVEEKIIVVSFDEQGIIDKIQQLDNNRQDIETVERKTKTGGNDVTVAEQLLGNIGRFNKQSDGGAVNTAGGL